MIKGIYFTVACLAALSNGINLGASMDDDTTDNVPIVGYLPIESDTASVEEQ